MPDPRPPVPRPDAEIERVLVVTAHPDDVDFAAGGTIAGFTAAGCEVSYLVCTAGDAGGFDPAVPRAEIPAIRRAEQQAAGSELGVRDVRFLDHPDGMLEVSLALRRDIARVIRSVRPQRLLASCPVRNFDRMPASHPDHLAAGEAALCAVYPDARNPFTFPELLGDEGLEPWSVDETWVMGGPDPNHYVDITATLPRKIAALLRHQSQLRDPGALEEMLRGWSGGLGRQAGWTDGRLAEAFRVIDTR